MLVRTVTVYYGDVLVHMDLAVFATIFSLHTHHIVTNQLTTVFDAADFVERQVADHEAHLKLNLSCHRLFKPALFI
jgi:hypothetical protein